MDPENCFFDLTILCRLCAEKSATINVFNISDKQLDCDIVTAVKTHLDIQVRTCNKYLKFNRKLSFEFNQVLAEDPTTGVCDECYSKVEQWTTFFSKCQLAQNKLERLKEQTIKSGFQVQAVDTLNEPFLENQCTKNVSEMLLAASFSGSETNIMPELSEPELSSVNSVVSNLLMLENGAEISSSSPASAESSKPIKRSARIKKKRDQEADEDSSNGAGGRIAKPILLSVVEVVNISLNKYGNIS